MYILFIVWQSLDLRMLSIARICFKLYWTQKCIREYSAKSSLHGLLMIAFCVGSAWILRSSGFLGNCWILGNYWIFEMYGLFQSMKELFKSITVKSLIYAAAYRVWSTFFAAYTRERRKLESGVCEFIHPKLSTRFALIVLNLLCQALNYVSKLTKEDLAINSRTRTLYFDGRLTGQVIFWLFVCGVY